MKEEESKYVGEMASQSLIQWETLLWEWEVKELGVPRFTDDGFRAALKIFMSALIERSWLLMRDEQIEKEDRLKMVESMGDELSRFVKTYTGIDTKKLYR